MTARELMKIVQSEYMRRMRFCARIDNSVTNYRCVFIAMFEHYLHMKRSILFSIVLIK